MLTSTASTAPAPAHLAAQARPAFKSPVMQRYRLPDPPRRRGAHQVAGVPRVNPNGHIPTTIWRGAARSSPPRSAAKKHGSRQPRTSPRISEALWAAIEAEPHAINIITTGSQRRPADGPDRRYTRSRLAAVRGARRRANGHLVAAATVAVSTSPRTLRPSRPGAVRRAPGEGFFCLPVRPPSSDVGKGQGTNLHRTE